MNFHCWSLLTFHSVFKFAPVRDFIVSQQSSWLKWVLYLSNDCEFKSKICLFREKIDISPIYIDMGWVPFFVFHLQMVMPAVLWKQTLHKWSQVSSLDHFYDFKVTTSRNFWASGLFSTCLSPWNNLCIIRIRCRLGFPLCLPMHFSDTPWLYVM